MELERQISTVVMWTWVAWGAAFVLLAAGTIVGIGWAEGERARMTSIAILAHGLALVGVAVCLNVRVMLRKQNRLMLDAMLLGRSGASSASVRRLKP